MLRARVPLEASHEIGEMVYEDLEQQLTSQEIAHKCDLIISLYSVIDTLAKRFGEVHLEYRQDDYAIIRVVFNDLFSEKDMTEGATKDDKGTPSTPVGK